MNQLAIQALDPALGDVSSSGSDLKSLNRGVSGTMPKIWMRLSIAR